MTHIKLGKLQFFIIITLLLTPFTSASGDEKWEIGLYHEPWVAFVDGTLGVNNFPSANIDSTELSGLLGLKAGKGNTGFYLEISGMKLKEDIPASSYDRVELRHSITELGGTYSFIKDIDFLAGSGIRVLEQNIFKIQPAPQKVSELWTFSQVFALPDT